MNTAAFSQDGQRVVTAGSDTTAQIWRVDGSGVPVVLKGHEDTVYSASLSPDGTRVVTASDNGPLRSGPSVAARLRWCCEVIWLPFGAPRSTEQGRR